MKKFGPIITSVKIPIDRDDMTPVQMTRLSQITGRDTRVIKAYLGVIERNQSQLRTGRRTQLDRGTLDELTLTTRQCKNNRTSVAHDFKARFPRISTNEFGQCRDTAIAMWTSYLEHGGARPLTSRNYKPRKIPRCVFPNCFSLVRDSSTSTHSNCAIPSTQHAKAADTTTSFAYLSLFRITTRQDSERAKSSPSE